MCPYYQFCYILYIAFQKVAEETKKVVEKEESQATAKAEETQAIAADAQRDLGIY